MRASALINNFECLYMTKLKSWLIHGKTQRMYRAGCNAHAATGADVSIDLWASIMLQRDGLVVAAIAAGLADDVLPGNAAVTIQHQLTDDAWCGFILCRYI